MCRLLDEIAVESDEVEKRESLRLRAIREVLQTEKTYLKSLELLIEHYVKPLKVILDQPTHNILFGHVEMIHNLNSELLQELEIDLNNVGSAFLRLGPFLKLYSVYAFDYKRVLLTLQDLQDKNAKFKSFLDRTETRPDVQKKLNSLLILPIQRVPRYKLLLQQVLLYTSPSERDFKILQDSVKQMENTAAHINSLVEDQENTQIMLNLQNSLVGRCPRIIEPCRKLIREGVLLKVTRKNETVRRYCTLMSDIFMYSRVCKERAPGMLLENSLECCCIFPLKKCKVSETLPGTFRIKCQEDEIILQSSDEEYARAWVRTIKEAIEQHIQFRKTLRKESSRRMPLRKKKDLRNLNSMRDDQPLSPRSRSSVYENVVKMISSRSDDEDEEESSSEEDRLRQLKCFKTHRPRWIGKCGRRKRDSSPGGNENQLPESGILSAKRKRIQDEEQQENIAPQDSSTPLQTEAEIITETEVRRRTVRFSDIKPVPFKYDDDQEYLNSKFLERTAPRKTIVKEPLTRRIWNFFNGLF